MPPLPKLTSATEGGKKRSISALHGSHNGAVSIPDRQAKALKKGPGAIPASASGPGFLERYIWGCSSAPRDVVNKIELDTQGDLWLLIRAAPNQADNFIGVRVASTFLRMASTVWAEQLQKNKKLEDMKLEAEDDDPEALLFVLRAIHLRATELPKQLTFDEVVKVAVVCAKYDAVATVNWKLFIRDRIDNFAKAAGTSKDFEDGTDAPLLKWYLAPGKEEWAFVAWTFGFASDFITLAKYLIRTGRTDGKGNLLNSKGHEMNGNFPPGMIDFMLQARSATMSRLLDSTYAIFRRLLAYPTEHLCEADKQKMDRNCGNFATSLTKLGLPMERPDVSAFHNSIEELVELLKKMRFDAPGDQADVFRGMFWDHIIEQPLEYLPDSVPDEFLKHMASQAAK